MRVIIAGLFVISTIAPVQASDALPTWMSGHWLSCAGGERVVEVWIAGETMLTATNITTGKTRETFEFLRVAGNGKGGVAYYAMPSGKPPTTFDMIVHKDQRVVFENAGHDFPQRVIYRREGDVLHARIEGTIKGKTESADWTFVPAQAGQGCKP